MTIRRIVPNISTTCLEESRQFYVELLGLEVAMDMDWIITLCSPGNATAQISLLRADEPVAASSAITISIEVEDVDAVHEKAVASNQTIVYPLTTEPWGVRRFHVQDPNGITINVMMHHD